MQIDHPWRLDRGGRTASTTDEDHLRDLIEQVLFTTPGERVNRPTFGSGLLTLVFSPTGVEQTATAQLLVQSSLQEWLGDLIQVEGVSVEVPAEGTIQVSVTYQVRLDQQRQTAVFRRGGQ
ncbi:MAG TPA: GPW/gp25 family protein [Vicinamibacteria bacterium]|nr:GPW/gp25 family protein [Vicinamibacteria bacterium]